jgi:hypothetical protein
MPQYNGAERRRNYDRRRAVRISRGRRQADNPSTEQVVIEALLRGIWQLITLPFKLGKKTKKGPLIPAAVALQLSNHWPVIQGHLENPVTRALAVTESDKLLDAAFQAAGMPGATMGERLQQAKTVFDASLYQQIWTAHKLRNTIAHEMGAIVVEAEAYQAVHTFGTALRALGVPI